MFRRYFYYWFFFFVAWVVLVGLFTLYDRWQSSREMEIVQTHVLAAQCLQEFVTLSSSSDRPENWEWSSLYGKWATQFESLKGIGLEDQADGRVVFSAGDFTPDWFGASTESLDPSPRWLTLGKGERVWTVLPAGSRNERYRLWVNLGVPLSFSNFLKERGNLLGAEIAFFFLLFALFYWWFANPTRYLKPMVETIQRALEHADSPLQVPASNLPHEFVPLAKSLSLILEARRNEHEERLLLKKQVDQHHHQKLQFSRMMKNLESARENEQSAIERIQNSLLEANREPVVILDRTKRILAMNEPARRILSLSGQTGYPLRHSELEEILEAELRPGNLPTDQRISVRDPYLGKTTHWKVQISVQRHGGDSGQIQWVLISLTEDDAATKGKTQSSEYLLRLLAGAWAESWSGGSQLPSPMAEEEKRLVDSLIRHLVGAPQERLDLPGVLGVFGLDTRGEFSPEAVFGEVGGGKEVWESFGEWFRYVLSKMSPQGVHPEIAGMRSSRLKLEWISETEFDFEEWFGSGETQTSAFRRELLQKSLEKIRAKFAWNPGTPEVISLDILLWSPLVKGGRRAPGLPLKVNV